MNVLDPLVAADALDALHTQVAVLGGDGRIVLVNDAWRRFAAESGTTSQVTEWTGVDYLEICRAAEGPDGEEGLAVAGGIASVLSGARHSFRLEYPCHTPTRRRWFQLDATPLPMPGAGVVVAHHDVTQRRETEIERNRLLAEERAARRRATFLAEAMEVLERALQVEHVCSALAELAAGALADLAVVDLFDERRRLRRLGVGVADADDAQLAGELRRWTAAPTGMRHPAGEAVREQRSVSGPVDSALLQEAFPPEHAVVVAALGVRSYLCVPLRGREGVIGTLTVASRAAHHYTEGADRHAIEDLARCAVLALDNAQLHSELARTARVLQQSLRPAPLPAIAGVDLAGSYRPAGATLLVGGDFYDVARIGPTEWSATIGDVCGKGAGAAAVTGLTRHTTRAAAAFGASPEGVLRALDEALTAGGTELPDDNRYCTALHLRGRRHEDGLHLELAGAGHVPPIVVRHDGATEIITCGGTLLGVDIAPQIGVREVELGPGDAIVLYTDGLLDAHAPARQLWAPDVAAALASSAGRGAAALVAAAEAVALDPGATRQRDDIAILTVAVPGRAA